MTAGNLPRRDYMRVDEFRNRIIGGIFGSLRGSSVFNDAACSAWISWSIAIVFAACSGVMTHSLGNAVWHVVQI